MSLEERNGKLYYYRSVRHGDTVRRVYVGSGELARIAHEGDVAEREAERAAEEHARREAELEPSPHRSRSSRRPPISSPAPIS
jgi:hypothetical protein